MPRAFVIYDIGQTLILLKAFILPRASVVFNNERISLSCGGRLLYLTLTENVNSAEGVSVFDIERTHNYSEVVFGIERTH